MGGRAGGLGRAGKLPENELASFFGSCPSMVAVPVFASELPTATVAALGSQTRTSTFGVMLAAEMRGRNISRLPRKLSVGGPPPTPSAPAAAPSAPPRPPPPAELPE